MTESGDWSYQKWCPKAKKLILDASRPALQQVVVVRLLHMLHPNMQGEIVQTFHSKQHLRRLRRREPPRRLEASPGFMNNSVTGLIGMSLKRETPNRGPMSKQLAQMVYGS